MKLHQVYYFLALCSELNFGRAAKRCNVSQPSLTNGIKRLEREFGGKLFDREHSGTRMTELGQLVRPHLLRVQNNCELAHDIAREFTARRRPQRTIGYPRLRQVATRGSAKNKTTITKANSATAVRR
jgi:LysR family transcriptional regulator, hydrogen peroxide-inducible genes activator